jgi:hypothetical protein
MTIKALIYALLIIITPIYARSALVDPTFIPVRGGYSQPRAPTSSQIEIAIKALNMVSLDLKFLSCISVSSQIVAGTNYVF